MTSRLFSQKNTSLLLMALTALSLSAFSGVHAAPFDPLASGAAADDGLGLDSADPETAAPQAEAASEKPAIAALPASQAAPLIDSFYKILDQAQSAETINQRLSLLAPEIQKIFDLDGILSRSVGRDFDHLSPEDARLLKESFYRYTLAHYAAIFKPGTSAVFLVNPEPKEINPHKVIIRTQIGGENDHDGGTGIDYVMQPKDGQWKITDVLLEGHISQVAAQRSDFKSSFRQGGAKALAELLDGKTQTELQGS